MKAYQVVLAEIESKIFDGTLKVGSALPAERDLAEQLGVSRTAVREALMTLQAQGIIEARVGSGPHSGTFITDHPSQALGKLLQMHVELGQFPITDVVEARVMLERRSAKLAARYAGKSALAELAELLEKMETPQMELDEFNKLDTKYHVAIATSSNNQLITSLTTAIRQSLTRPIRIASEQMPDWQLFRLELIKQHQMIFEAISARNEQLAADLVDKHIRIAYSILKIDQN